MGESQYPQPFMTLYPPGRVERLFIPNIEMVVRMGTLRLTVRTEQVVSQGRTVLLSRIQARYTEK